MTLMISSPRHGCVGLAAFGALIARKIKGRVMAAERDVGWAKRRRPVPTIGQQTIIVGRHAAYAALRPLSPPYEITRRGSNSPAACARRRRRRAAGRASRGAAPRAPRRSAPAGP